MESSSAPLLPAASRTWRASRAAEPGLLTYKEGGAERPVLTGHAIRDIGGDFLGGSALKLSIVIPVFNEEKFILEVLRKVAQVPVEKELIVVDDCSRARKPSPSAAASSSTRASFR